MSLVVRQVLPPSLRRHADPPGLWIGVLAGSLALNGILFMSFQRYLQPVKTVAAFAPISIDLVPANSALEVNSTTQPRSVSTTKLTARTATSTSNLVPESTASSVMPKAGEVSIASSDQLVRPRSTVSPPVNLTSDESVTKSQETQTDVSTTAAGFQATAAPSASQSDPEVPEDQVATSNELLPGFVEPPDPKTNTGASEALATDLVGLNRKATRSRYLMQVKVLALEGNSPTEAVPLTEHPEQSQTLLSGEAGCFVTPEALHYFNQSLDYTLTLNEQGTVVDAVPVGTTLPMALESYQNLVTCSLKTWKFDREALAVSPSQPRSNKLAVRVILQKQ